MPAEPAQPVDSDDLNQTGISEVRYSLPTLLKEIYRERATAAFALEKLDQVEIGKLFAKKRSRRALNSRK
jgi:hypothetical protein